MENTEVVRSRDQLERYSQGLKLAVGALMLVLAAVPLVGDVMPQQDLTGRFLLLATSRTGTMQQELEEAAEAGYRVLTASPTSGHEIALILEKVATPPDTYKYLLLATTKTGTMQRELEEAATAGFRLVPDTMISKKMAGIPWSNLQRNLLNEIVVIMERSPSSSRRYQYMLLATTLTSTLQAEMAQAAENGYEVVSMVSRGEHIVILERSLDGG